MSLSKEKWAHVSSTTSVNSDPGDSALVAYAKLCIRDADAAVDNVFLDLADLERQVAVKMTELDLALSAQVLAHSNMPDMPALSCVNLHNAINLGVELEPRRPIVQKPRASRPVPNLLPVKSAMESATRPAGRKPSKGDVPTTSADSALLNTTT